MAGLTLPELEYDYKSLAPIMSAEQLRIHHTKHHAAYVAGANSVLEQLEKARSSGNNVDIKAALKTLSFMLGGHILHTLFWKNLTPKGGGQPTGQLAQAINASFGSFERFRQEFTQAALSIEGSGWAALAHSKELNRLVLVQIEKHNANLSPSLSMLLVLDMWEHAFYIDYKNDKQTYVEGFWKLVNWGEVASRLKNY